MIRLVAAIMIIIIIISEHGSPSCPGALAQVRAHVRGGEEEEEDLFVFNDTIEGPRAHSHKVTKSLKPDESEGCSPVCGLADDYVTTKLNLQSTKYKAPPSSSSSQTVTTPTRSHDIWDSEIRVWAADSERVQAERERVLLGLGTIVHNGGGV